jgi:hypothetical protein
MAMVTVYRFTVYDITTDENHVSRRMGTREAIASARGSPIENTACDVDEAELGQDIVGMTDRDFWFRATGAAEAFSGR